MSRGGRAGPGAGPGRGIAIIGMSCLFPGAPNLDAYWRNILGKVDAVTDPPPEACEAACTSIPTPSKRDRVYCKRGGYLGALATFDPLAHGIPPVAVGGEPDQWLALQLARDALADAGCLRLDEAVRAADGGDPREGDLPQRRQRDRRPARAGRRVRPWRSCRDLHPEHTEEELEALRRELKRALPPFGPETVPGLIPNVIVGRIANRLDLMGPTYTVDAACASSLVAVQHGDAGPASTATATWRSPAARRSGCPMPTLSIFCQLGALSRRQQIRPFDKDADGTLLGEGIGMVVLKRLDDAERDGDRIYAVIRGVGVASDGRGRQRHGAPRRGGGAGAAPGLRRGRRSPRTVGLIEAHGTGTPVGDVAEVAGADPGLRRRATGELPRCALGSVKSMISHTMPAAGVAGIIKVALALHHKVLPPTLQLRRAEPEAGAGEDAVLHQHRDPALDPRRREPRRAGRERLRVRRDQRPRRPRGIHPVAGDRAAGSRGRRATARRPRPGSCRTGTARSASSGPNRPANLLEEARPAGPSSWRRADAPGHPARGPRLHAQPGPDRLGSGLPMPAGPGRHARRPTSGRSSIGPPSGWPRPTAARSATSRASTTPPSPWARRRKLAFLFPGEGAQYPNMLADLCLHFPEVRECFDQIDRVYFGHPRGYCPATTSSPGPRAAAERRAASTAPLGDRRGRRGGAHGQPGDAHRPEAARALRPT